MRKTNVTRILDQKKVAYEFFDLNTDETNGVEIAGKLGVDESKVFKTLVTTGLNKIYVFMIPVASTLDLKKCAKAVGVKSLEMLKSKDLLSTVGYVHGGCSPIGMKKLFPTILDLSAKDLDYIYCSAGKIGMQIKINPKDIINLIGGRFEDITM